MNAVLNVRVDSVEIASKYWCTRWQSWWQLALRCTYLVLWGFELPVCVVTFIHFSGGTHDHNRNSVKTKPFLFLDDKSDELFKIATKRFFYMLRL